MKNLLFIASLLCLAVSSMQAQSVNDELELQAFTRRFMAAYNAQDHAAIGKMYTDDAVRIDQQGKEIVGAENIAAFFAEQFIKNNATLLLKHIGINWSDAEHAWVTKGTYEVYGKTIVYDIAINIVGSYANAMQKKDGEWKIAKSVLTPMAQVTSPLQNVVIGKIDSIQSEILGEQRKFWVYVPDHEASNVYSPQRYPVVYILDGDAHFYSVVGMIQQLSSVNGNMMCPKMIVVGIPNTDRTRDLTPTHIDVDPMMNDSAFVRTSGGGENFISFMEKELMPFIESKYPTAPYKMLIGHSFGGLAVMQTFTHHNSLFNAYISIDPSMWWDNQKLLKETKTFLKNTKLEGKSLYLGIANTMEEGMDLKKVTKDTSKETDHIRSILALQTALESNKQNGLNYRGKYYADDTHGSAPLITTYDALRYFFDFYPMKISFKDFIDSTAMVADKYQNHFASLSKKMGYTIKPDEMEINYFGYEALNAKHYKKAEGLFKLNVDNYPESFNVHDSYADYFIAIGDKANAAIQLKKALTIKENEGSRKKLAELEVANK